MVRPLKRFFISQTLGSQSKAVTLSESESHHLQNVLRLALGDNCLVFDAAGHEWTGSVVLDKTKHVQIKLLTEHQKKSVKLYYLAIAQAIPHRGKMDGLVEKAAELGIDSIIPMITERTIVRMSAANQSKAHMRWLKIIQEARKQSHSDTLTEIVEPVDFHSVLERIQDQDAAFLFHPQAKQQITEVLSGLRSRLKEGAQTKITVLIGPEGGFTEGEMVKASKKGMQSVRLGESILKADTAFIAIASMFQFGLS